MMKRTIKRGISILLALGLMLGLAACGGGGEKSTDPNVGTWKAVSGSMLGMTMPIEEFFDSDVILDLKDGGKCDLNLDGEKASGTWSFADGALTIEADGITMSGTITSDGILTLENLLDMGLDLTFEKEGGYSGGAAQAPEGDGAELAGYLDWWNGDWYGYWETSASGPYAGMDGRVRDVHAEISVGADGKGTITLWTYEDLGTAEIQVTEDGGSGDMGAATSEGGDFYGLPLAHADWIIDPSLYDYDSYMVIDGSYEDADGDGFFYWIYLRPWGVSWDDVPEDERPYDYDYWYVDVLNEDMQDAIRDMNGYIPASVDRNPGSGGTSAPAEPTGTPADDNPGEYVWSDRLSISWDTDLFYLDDWGLQDIVAQDESVKITLTPFSNTDSYISAMETLSTHEGKEDYKLNWLAFGDYEVTLATFHEYGTWRAHAYINFGNEGQEGQRYYGLYASCASTVSAEAAWNESVQAVLATAQLLP